MFGLSFAERNWVYPCFVDIRFYGRFAKTFRVSLSKCITTGEDTTWVVTNDAVTAEGRKIKKEFGKRGGGRSMIPLPYWREKTRQGEEIKNDECLACLAPATPRLFRVFRCSACIVRASAT